MLKFLFKKKLYKQLNINKIKILAIRYYNNQYISRNFK